MNRIEHKYEELAVKINSNGINGSGCIIQPPKSDYTFVFTAKHCLTDDNSIEKENITISTNHIPKINVQGVMLDKKLDIAVIQIDKIPDIKVTCFSSPEKDLPIHIFGFPNLLKGENQIISGKISFDREKHSEIELSQSQITFEKSSPDTIKGFSGSGIFHEQSDRLSIVGILTKLKAQDGAYNNICSFHISTFDNLITSNGLPSIFHDYFDDIVYDYSFSFTNYNSELEKHYLTRNIDTVFNRSIQSPKNLWINGVSGVGKTLLVNRNLKFNNKNFIAIDLTTSSLDNIEEYFKVINNEIINQKEIEKPNDNGNIYDNIAFNLNKLTNKEVLLISVDEVPIKDKDIFSKFLTGFIKISEKYSNTTTGSCQIKWIISTRINPDDYIKNLDDCLVDKQKAVKHFIFKSFEKWTENELLELINLLEKNLNFQLSNNTKQKVIEVCNGIPNPIKRVIELILIDNCTIEDAIETVKTEHVL